MKSDLHSDRVFRLRRTIAWPVMVATLPLSSISALAQSLPTGGAVTAGQATITTPSGNALVVRQDSQRAVVRWGSFGVGQGSTVTFAQPNAGAATLNVVAGGTPSEIAGSLKANGSVFLINPSGIAITPTGLVDTRAGFVASTLGIDEGGFMAGRLSFAGVGGAVVNRGTILTGAGGTVALLGGSVDNGGVIRAPLGKVALGAGQAATLDLAGDGFLQVMLPPGSETADGQALVRNGGVIEADGGTVMLKAATVREALRDAVHVPGEIRARSVSGHDGAIVLEGGAGGSTRVSGVLDVSATDGAASGGRIDVSGDHVALEGATLRATGPDRGGLVRVGGGYQGGRPHAAGAAGVDVFVNRFGAVPALANARATEVDAASRIDVSATGAQGVGGTAVVWSDQATAMGGAIAARGAASGGAVEVSSASTVQSVALGRLDLGRGGQLLLDPQDIVISDAASGTPAGNLTYADPGPTLLNSADLATLLGAGTSISLQASQDIDWSTFFMNVVRSGASPVGDLNLSAGRSIRLQGSFTNNGSRWTFLANDTAAHGVIDAERGAGGAGIDLSGAQFINSNGALSLTVADGAGNTNRGVDGIRLGRFQGDALSAMISPTAIPEGPTPHITLGGEISAANAVTLSGNLRVSGGGLVAGRTVSWLTEATDRIVGEGAIRFTENGVTTRLGWLMGADAVRLALGNDAGGAITRAYGDTNPDGDHLGRAPVHVVSGTPAGPLDTLFQAGSITVSGPGVTTPVGTTTMTLSGSATAAVNPGATGYFVDMTPATVALTITPRVLTPTVSNGAYTYGSPTAVVGLAGVVDGDTIAPVATLGGTAGIALGALGGGFAFGDRVAAGSTGFSLTGLAGAGASNYSLDLGGTTSGTLTIARKDLTYVVAGSTGQTYGTLGALPTGYLGGTLAGDDVSTVVGLGAAGQPVAHAARLGAGTYLASVTGLTGVAAANYQVAAAGNTDMNFVVAPKPLTWSTADAWSTYGTLATLGASALDGVLAGDVVGHTVGLSGTTLGATTRAGSYAEVVTGLTGASAGNYQLAGAGNHVGTLTVAPKPIGYTGADVTQAYGSATLPSPTLNGVVGADDVGITQWLSVLQSTTAGGSGAWTVGRYSIDVYALNGADAANYSLVRAGSSATTVTIAPKLLNFQVAGGGSTYGALATLPGATLSGVVPGDVIGSTTGLFTAQGAVGLAHNTAAGTYTLGVGSLLGTGAGNYTVAATGNTAGAFTIAPRVLQWQVGSGSAVYGDTATNPVALDTLVAGDTVLPHVGALDGGGAEIVRPAVGSHTAGVTSLGGASAGNYVLASSGNTTGTLTVTPRPVTWTVADAQSVYGTLATPGAIGFGNVLAGDTVGGVLGLALDPRLAAGRYTESVTGLTGNTNYMLAATGNTSGTLTVAPKPLSFDTANTSASTTYGTAAVLAAGSLSGVLAGDVVSAGPTTLRGAGVPGAQQNAGHYELSVGSLSGASAGNYVLAEGGSTFGTLDIAPKTVTYDMSLWWASRPTASTHTYGELYRFGQLGFGDANDGGRATLSGVVGNDNVSVVVAAPTVPVSSTNYFAVGTYEWRGTGLTGAAASNYVLAGSGNTNGVLTITPADLRVTLFPTNAFGAYTPGIVYGNGAVAKAQVELYRADQVTASASFLTASGAVGQLGDRTGVGSYPIVLNGIAGVDAGNYRPVVAFDQPLVITPKPLAFQLANSGSTYGQQAAIGATAVTGILPGDDVAGVVNVYDTSLNPVTLTPRTNAGMYPTRLDGLAGADAGNYLIGAVNPGSYVNIAKAQLSLGVDPAVLSQTYGAVLPAYTALSGILFGDDVAATPMARPVQVVRGGTGLRTFDGPLLDAGTYDYVGLLSGAAANNYWMPAQGRITIAPRPVTVAVFDIATTYGTYVAPAWRIDNVVPGELIWGSVAISNTLGQGVGYNDRTNAGTYRMQVVDLTGDTAANYQFDIAKSTPGSLAIAQKTLSFSMPSAANSVYGSAAPLASIGGVLFGDDVGVRTTGTTAMPSQRLADDGQGHLSYTSKLDVGAYTFAVSDQTGLVGAKAGNYRLDPVAEGTLSVAPKPLVYAVEDMMVTYGGYKSCETYLCHVYDRRAKVGAARLDGVLAGDTVGATVGLVDFAGQASTYEFSTDAGTYFEVVTGLTGASARNYTVAPSGSKPGILQVTPLTIGWSTSSGVYLNGYGLAGTPGVATLRGPDGSPLFGDEVFGVVTAFDPRFSAVPDLLSLVEGRYTFKVTSLAGRDARNYQLRPPVTNIYRNYHGLPGDDVGTLDVFADTRLGMQYVGLGSLPPVQAPEPPMDNSVGRPIGAVTAPELSTISRDGFGIERGTESTHNEFERPTTLTGADGDARIGPTGGGVSGAAAGSVEANLDAGPVDFSAYAGATVDALAKFGVTGVKIEANAEAHVDITMSYGPGYVTFGAQGNASVDVSLGRNGLSVSADASAGLYASGGVAGNLGSVGAGAVSVTTGTFAYARADNQYTFKDGKLVAKVQESVGVGASVGTSGSLSGSAGRVEAGATFYSPGSLGFGMSWNAGYSDGALTIGLDLGAQLGLGGLNLSFSFTINIADSPIGSLFGMSRNREHPGVGQSAHAMTLAGDPLARFAYLSQNRDWMNYEGADKSNVDFFQRYSSVLSRTNELIGRQQAIQNTFLDLLKTDPQGAADYMHSGIIQQTQRELNWLSADATRLNIKLAVKDGKLDYVYRPPGPDR